MSTAQSRAVKLRLPEHFRWLLLRRVKGGGVARSGDGWFRHGNPLSPFLADFFGDLLEEGLIEVADPAPEDGLSRVSLYGALCTQQRAPLPPPQRAIQNMESPT